MRLVYACTHARSRYIRTIIYDDVYLRYTTTLLLVLNILFALSSFLPFVLIVGDAL